MKKLFQNFALWGSLLVLALPALTSAADIQALVGARVVTVDGEIIDPGVVLIGSDGRITAVGPETQIIIPDDAEEHLLEGHTLYPGLITLDSSLGLTGISAVRQSNDTGEQGEWHAHLRSWSSHNPDRLLVDVARSGGLTHALVRPLTSGRVHGRSGLLALSGWTWEERLVKAPAALHLSWPGMGLNFNPDAKPSLSEQKENREEELEKLRERLRQARAYAQAAANPSGMPLAVDLDLAAWGPFLDGSAPIFIHANDRRQLRAAIEWARDEDLRIVLVGGTEAPLMAEEIAEAGIPLVYERTMNGPEAHATVYQYYEGAGVLDRAGVELVLAHGAGPWQDTLQRNIPYSAGMSVAHGLDEASAIAAMTLNPARILGVDDRLGSITVGKEASLIAVRGSVLEPKDPVTHMWIKGQSVELSSRQTRLYERYRSRPMTP